MESIGDVPTHYIYPEHASAVSLAISKLKASLGSHGLITIVPMLDAKIQVNVDGDGSASELGIESGVYSCLPDTPAWSIMRQKDLCGGVSLYKIRLPDNGSVTETTMREVANKVKTSALVKDMSKLEHYDHKGVSFGEEKCSISLVRGILNDYTLEYCWFLVIKNYHNASSKRLFTFIHGLDDSQTGEDGRLGRDSEDDDDSDGEDIDEVARNGYTYPDGETRYCIEYDEEGRPHSRLVPRDDSTDDDSDGDGTGDNDDGERAPSAVEVIREMKDAQETEYGDASENELAKILRRYTLGITKDKENLPSIQQVYNSGIYKECLRNSQTCRDAIAHSIIAALGVANEPSGKRTEILEGHKVTCIEPWSTSFYNAVSVMDENPYSGTYEGLSYNYYRDCLTLSESKARCVAIEMSANKGWYIIGAGNAAELQLGTSSALYGFPMACPELSTNDSQYHTQRERDATFTRHFGSVTNISWSSDYQKTLLSELAPKVLDDGIFTEPSSHNQKIIAMLKDISFCRQDVHCVKLVPISIYLSSVSDLKLTSRQLVERSEGLTTVRVPVKHPLTEAAISFYTQVKKKFPGARLSVAVPKEDEHYMYFSKALISNLLAAYPNLLNKN